MIGVCEGYLVHLFAISFSAIKSDLYYEIFGEFLDASLTISNFERQLPVRGLTIDMARIDDNQRIDERELTETRRKIKGGQKKRERKNDYVILVGAYVCRSPAARRDLAGVHENWAACAGPLVISRAPTLNLDESDAVESARTVSD